METFQLSNQVRIGISQALLLVYRYLSGIYAFGDLSFVQFLSGYLRGKGRSLDGCRVLTVSGNGIGELEKLLLLQWRLEHLETMGVNASSVRIIRMLLGASHEELTSFFEWAMQRLEGYPSIRSLLNYPGLADYWRQQCDLWQSSRLNSHIKLVGGVPWDIPESQKYDAILMSHSQTLLREHDAKDLLAYLNPGGLLATVTPVIFRPDELALEDAALPRFSDLQSVETIKQGMREAAKKMGYDMPYGKPAHIHWSPQPQDTAHVVSFSISSPLRSLLIGELLIQSLTAEVPDNVRLSLLESSLADIPPGAGAGAESLLILVTEKEGNSNVGN
jgi:hypothetical protein